MNEKFKYSTKLGQVQYEEFRVHSVAKKCDYLQLNRELQVSNPFIIQTECIDIATIYERTTATAVAKG